MDYFNALATVFVFKPVEEIVLHALNLVEVTLLEGCFKCVVIRERSTALLVKKQIVDHGKIGGISGQLGCLAVQRHKHFGQRVAGLSADESPEEIGFDRLEYGRGFIIADEAILPVFVKPKQEGNDDVLLEKVEASLDEIDGLAAKFCMLQSLVKPCVFEQIGQMLFLRKVGFLKKGRM